MKKLSRFEINYDNPLKIYFTGKILSGKVIVELTHSMEMKGLHLDIFGISKIKWFETEDGQVKSVHNHSNPDHYVLESPHSPDKQHSKHIPAIYKEFKANEEYFHEVITLWGQGNTDKDNKLIMAAGFHSFQFKFRLPQDLPSSFEADGAYIRYISRAAIVKPWKFNHVSKSAFTIINQYDLNLDDSASTPFDIQDEKSICCLCCQSGPISCSVHIPRIGYVPGECINFTAEVINDSRQKIKSMKAQLIQCYTLSTPNKSSMFRRTVSDSTAGEVKSKSKFTWSHGIIPVPPLPPSYLNGCEIIHLTYQLNLIASDIELSIPIIIGTIPMRCKFKANSPNLIGRPNHFSKFVRCSSVNDAYPEFPLPMYAESEFGPSNISDDMDSKYTFGELMYTPMYPYYTTSRLPSEA